MDQFKDDQHSWREAPDSAAEYDQRHRKCLANLLAHTGGRDSLILDMTRIRA